MFEPHQPEPCDFKPDVLLDVTPVWERKRQAMESMEAQRHLIDYAGVRDTTAITAMEFPVWSSAVSVQGTSKTCAGSVNVPVVCAGASVFPGDVIVGDADGVVVVPRESAAAVVAAADERAKEERTRARLQAGELGLDIYNLRDVLAQRGVVWRD